MDGSVRSVGDSVKSDNTLENNIDWQCTSRIFITYLFVILICGMSGLIIFSWIYFLIK